MTNEELRKFVREVANETKGNIVVADFAVAVAKKAVLAEREACAKLCDDLDATDSGGYCGDARQCASLIRERSNTEINGPRPQAEGPR